MTRQSYPGIPLPEALLAVMILGLLAATIIPGMVYSGETRASECRANVALLNAEVDRIARQQGACPPADAEEFEQMVAQEKGLFPRGMPKCPCGQPYEYDPASGQVVPHRH